VRSLSKPRKERYPPHWASWTELRPSDDYFAGAIQNATSRKHCHRRETRVTQCTRRTQQQRETASAATEINLKNHTFNALFQDRNLPKKMKKREMKIDQILKDLPHVPHLSRSETTSPQTKMYVGSGVSISTELSDEEMREEMGSGLHQDD
jgi:hypothetical protein